MSNEWTASEKKIARRVFDAALNQELADVLQVFKAMAANAADAEAMWATEEFLSTSRREIEAKYDFRYSQLHMVFGKLLREGRIAEADIAGLSDDNLNKILRCAEF